MMNLFWGRQWRCLRSTACCDRSVLSGSLSPCGLQPARLLCPWDSPGKNTAVGCHALLQGIFPTQGLQADSLPLGRLGSPTQHHECGKYHRIRRSKCLIPCYAHPPQWWSTPGPAFSPWGFSPPSFLLTVHLFTEPPVSPSPLSVRGGTVLRCLYLQPSWGEMCSELLSSQLSRPSPAPGAEEKER